jgi:integrase
MPVEKISVHNINLESRKTIFKKKCPQEYRKAFEFLRLASLGEINNGLKVQEATQRKYLDFLAIVCNNIKKPLEKINKKDMQNFIENVQRDKILKHNKNPYSEATKRDIKIFLKTYLKWLLPEKCVELTGWFDTKLKSKTPEILKEHEVERLYKECRNNSERFLIACLFDGGFRIEEFLNIRFEDIEEPTQEFPYYKMNIREEFSKTAGRNVGMYWKHSTEAIREYLKENNSSAITMPVYAKKYDSVRVFITRLGKSVLKKRVHAHIFRKSSATYYSSKLNRQQLCVRYGWKFSSDMVDVYIKRSGVAEEEIKEKMVATNFKKLENENQDLKESLLLLKAEQEKMMIELERRSKLDPVLDKIFANKKFVEILEKELKQSS